MSSNQACYNSGGNQDSSIYPCDPGSSESSCCPVENYCFSNGLCQTIGVNSVNSTVFTIYGVHGCTDPSGTTGECEAFAKCSTGTHAGVGVTSCGTQSGSPAFCCYGLKGCDCTNSTQVFTLPVGSIINTILPSTSTSSMSSTSSKTSSTTSPSTHTTSAAATSAAPTPDPSNNSVAVGVGVGVGVGVALLVAVGLGLYLWRRRKNNRGAEQAQHHNGFENYRSADAKHAPAYSSVPQNDESLAGPQAPYSHGSELDASRSPVQIDTSREVKPPQSGPSELPSERWA